MELDEFIEKCASPDELAAFISSPGEGLFVRLWESDFTVDITVDEYKKSLHDYIGSFACPMCHTDTVHPPVAHGIKGLFARCPTCGQRFFIHAKLPFGGTNQ